MINNVIQGIAEALKKEYPKSDIYYNPVDDIPEKSFVINYLNSSITREPGDIDYLEYHFVIYYVTPGIQEKLIEGSTEDRMFQAGKIAEHYKEILETIQIGGFYDDKTITVTPYNMNIIPKNDIFNFFMTLSFRGKRINEETTADNINDYQLYLTTE